MGCHQFDYQILTRLSQTHAYLWRLCAIPCEFDAFAVRPTEGGFVILNSILDSSQCHDWSLGIRGNWMNYKGRKCVKPTGIRYIRRAVCVSSSRHLCCFTNRTKPEGKCQAQPDWHATRWVHHPQKGENADAASILHQRRLLEHDKV